MTSCGSPQADKARTVPATCKDAPYAAHRQSIKITTEFSGEFDPGQSRARQCGQSRSGDEKTHHNGERGQAVKSARGLGADRHTKPLRCQWPVTSCQDAYSLPHGPTEQSSTCSTDKRIQILRGALLSGAGYHSRPEASEPRSAPACPHPEEGRKRCARTRCRRLWARRGRTFSSTHESGWIFANAS